MLSLTSLLEALKEIGPSVVVVTGPQRSGTTIAAHILAAELYYEYHDEVSFGVHDCHKFFDEKLQMDAVVVHAPGAFHCLMDGEVPDDVVVVCMVRSILDIAASETRVHFKHGENERKRIRDTSTLPVSQAKYALWYTQLKPRIKHAYELDYESLRESDLWINKDKRGEFTLRQWKDE